MYALVNTCHEIKDNQAVSVQVFETEEEAYQHAEEWLREYRPYAVEDCEDASQALHGKDLITEHVWQLGATEWFHVVKVDDCCVKANITSKLPGTFEPIDNQ